MEGDPNRDPLTGCYNRRYAFDSLVRLLPQSDEQSSELAVGMIDIYNFKRINDCHGHAFGDDVLWEITRMLETCFSRRNIVSRFGGDEFLVIFNGVPHTHVHTLAERARSEVKRLPHSGEQKLEKPLTVTIGLAFYPEHGQTPEELIRAAGRALNEGRNMGGDHVISA
jgi:diguanylate cyclase (GGDEF)-like protein